jgi:23S rRNA-/tRNA-specific pseudouridylate synthase
MESNPDESTALVPGVLAETQDFWVIDKPAGWLSVPGRSGEGVRRLPVLVDWVRENLGPAWVCHRLDVGTSGVWLVARNQQAHRTANGWFEQHQVKKEYLFLASGQPALPVLRLDAPIDGARSVTQVQVRERWVESNGFLGIARPQSGRRHQIRIHLSGVGHPLWGDLSYGSTRTQVGGLGISRPALHASRLELPDGQVFECPLARDFEAWLGAAQKGAG